MNRTLHDGVETEGSPPDSSGNESLLRPSRKTPMPFAQMFVRVLPRQPLVALGALYWQLTRRRVRARNQLSKAAAALPFAYDFWIREAEHPSSIAQLAPQEGQTGPGPLISIVVDAHSASRGDLERTVRSVQEQSYREWSLDLLLGEQSAGATLADDRRIRAAPLGDGGPRQALSAALAGAAGDFIIVLSAGVRLAPTAVLRVAAAAGSETAPLVIYGDHDEITGDGRRRHPWFKPAWNEEMFLALDYLSPAVAIEKGVAVKAAEAALSGPGSFRDGLLLEATRMAAGRVMHIPHILAHAAAGDRSCDGPQRARAIEAHLEGTGASVTTGPFGTVRVSWPLPARLPLVSIIVPTRDKLELLKPCVETLLDRTSYREFELLVVDNGSVEPAASYLKELDRDPQARVLRYDHEYNFSAINNFAAGHARGSYLCLLNNDTEVVDGEWLTELMRYAVRPEVGAVGAKLLYPDGKIQHAGVVIGLGEAAGHAHRFDAADEPGYFCQAHVAQFVSAVTAACLVVEKRKFDAVGGLDAEGFPVAFNDVDFCLKLQQAGWRNVYTPHAVLIHHESKSRGKDHAPANVARFTREHALLQRRWGTRGYEDPLHNPNLDRQSERFILRL